MDEFVSHVAQTNPSISIECVRTEYSRPLQLTSARLIPRVILGSGASERWLLGGAATEG